MTAMLVVLVMLLFMVVLLNIVVAVIGVTNCGRDGVGVGGCGWC